MKNFKRILTVATMILVVASLFADGILNSNASSSLDNYTYRSQLNLTGVEAGVPKDAAAQAVGSANYPVTPGDQYTLTFFDGKSSVTEVINIGSDYNAPVASIGNINAKGMTMAEFKKKVETMINTYYQYSVPQLMLTNCGVFNVRVSGDAKYASYVTVWGLSRLSDLAFYANETASTREVVVVSPDGTRKTYDLYNGLINGNESDDPLLIPGEQVIFQKASTTVSLDGSTKKTGVFQLKKGETLKNLIDNYGNGFAYNAEADSIVVSNYDNGTFNSTVYTLADAASYVMKDGDMVSVKSVSRTSAFITIEGAVSSPDTKDSKFFYSISPAATAESIMPKIASYFLGSSDPSGFYIERDGKKLEFDAEAA
ncbi:MAG: hypothetical protein KBS81_08380, partial [Spirochaetales bacterium]|nr:hypothetical protein [Candidatus Physcosoma equi]